METIYRWPEALIKREMQLRATVWHQVTQQAVVIGCWLLTGVWQLATVKQKSRQVSRGSVGVYQADEQAGVTRLSWPQSSRRTGRWEKKTI